MPLPEDYDNDDKLEAMHRAMIEACAELGIRHGPKD